MALVPFENPTYGSEELLQAAAHSRRFSTSPASCTAATSTSARRNEKEALLLAFICHTYEEPGAAEVRGGRAPSLQSLSHSLLLHQCCFVPFLMTHRSPFCSHCQKKLIWSLQANSAVLYSSVLTPWGHQSTRTGLQRRRPGAINHFLLTSSEKARGRPHTESPIAFQPEVTQNISKYMSFCLPFTLRTGLERKAGCTRCHPCPLLSE